MAEASLILEEETERFLYCVLRKGTFRKFPKYMALLSMVTGKQAATKWSKNSFDDYMFRNFIIDAVFNLYLE